MSDIVKITVKHPNKRAARKLSRIVTKVINANPQFREEVRKKMDEANTALLNEILYGIRP
jgi:hypothetical protein